MGRFDALTQLDENQSPVQTQQTTGESVNGVDAAAINHSPSPLLEKPQRKTATQKKQKLAGVPVPERVPVGVGVRVPPPVPLTPKAKRAIRQRQPFDIYEDQYHRLKKIADDEKDFENGRGMSQMVRIAIDNYLRDHDIPQE